MGYDACNASIKGALCIFTKAHKGIKTKANVAPNSLHTLAHISY